MLVSGRRTAWRRAATACDEASGEMGASVASRVAVPSRTTKRRRFLATAAAALAMSAAFRPLARIPPPRMTSASKAPCSPMAQDGALGPNGCDRGAPNPPRRTACVSAMASRCASATASGTREPRLATRGASAPMRSAHRAIPAASRCAAESQYVCRPSGVHKCTGDAATGPRLSIVNPHMLATTSSCSPTPKSMPFTTAATTGLPSLATRMPSGIASQSVAIVPPSADTAVSVNTGFPAAAQPCTPAGLPGSGSEFPHGSSFTQLQASASVGAPDKPLAQPATAARDIPPALLVRAPVAVTAACRPALAAPR